MTTHYTGILAVGAVAATIAFAAPASAQMYGFGTGKQGILHLLGRGRDCKDRVR
jgi:hypothetical protein